MYKMARDKSNWYAGVVGIIGIMILLFLSGSGIGQALALSLVGSGSGPGAVGTRYYEVTTITTNYHMAGGGSGLDWRWVEIFKTGSSMIGKQINTISLPLKATGSPIGSLNVAVFGPTGVQKYNFGTIGASTWLGATTQWYTFKGDTTYTVVADDRIGVAFNGGNAANYVTAFGANTNPFETDVASRQRYNSTHWVGAISEDLTAVIGFSTVTGGADTTMPSVAITNLAQGATVISPFTVSGTASDNVAIRAIAGVEVKAVWVNPLNPLDISEVWWTATPNAPGNWASWTASINPTKATTITARATDTSGNQNWFSVNVNLITTPNPSDTTPPTISISTPANSASITSTTVGVTGVASDNVKISTITWSMDGGPPAPVGFTGTTSTSWSFTALDVPLGTHTITVRTLDTAGLSATSQVSFTVASTDPIPDPVCPTGSTWNPTLKVCVGNPADPVCPAGFTWNTVTKTCDQDDLPNPTSQFSFGMFEVISSLGILGAVIGTKVKTMKK